MKINLQDVSYKNIKNIIIAATFATIVIYLLLLRSTGYIWDTFTFLEKSWPFVILHAVLAVVTIVLMVKMKKGRASLWLTLVANLISFCWIGLFVFLFNMKHFS